MSFKILNEIRANQRKEEFKINTFIGLRNSKKVVIKKANTHTAKLFLSSFIIKQDLSVSFFGNRAEIVKGKYENNQIEYPYFDYPSLEFLIFDAIHQGDFEFGVSHIKNYCNFINDLPIKKCIPKEFINDFNVPDKILSGSYNCLYLGVIDLIPANILVKQKKWFIIDHEWIFNYPVPIDFIIYRSIYSLMINLQNTIQLNVTNHSKVALFQGFNLNNTFIPITWLTLLNSLDIPIKKLYYLEYLFKKKVFKYSKLGYLRISNQPKLYYNITPKCDRILYKLKKRILS